MSKLKFDEFTKQHAIDYADQEADLKGFARGSEQWKAAVKRQLSFSRDSMSVGRNPIKRNPRDDNNWPEIFGSDGFAAKVANNWKGKAGEKPDRRQISERVKSSVSALVYMYLNGVMDIRTTTKTSESGKIQADQMSDLQFRGKGEGDDDENVEVIFNQLILTVVETCAYEFISLFLTTKKEDIIKVTKGFKYEGGASAKEMAALRDQAEKQIRAAIGVKLKGLSFAKIVTGQD